MALSSSLNLDMTVNPDFSQIEVDKQVTNLTRFNIFLPGKRTFFLENSSLFSSYGIPSVRPFYSRRIGLEKNGNKIPILLGVRLTGNASKSTRIGLLNMQTGSQGDYSAENYTPATINQAVLKRSTLNLYFMNRQGFLSDSAKKADPLSAYGRNLGGVVKNHPLIGLRILEPIGFLADVLPGVSQHHERFDGFGYPRGLRGEQMTLEARILAVADAYDAMITERPYRKPLLRRDAIAELQRCSGKQFDPLVVESFIEILDNEEEIRQLEERLLTVGA